MSVRELEPLVADLCARKAEQTTIVALMLLCSSRWHHQQLSVDDAGELIRSLARAFRAADARSDTCTPAAPGKPPVAVACKARSRATELLTCAAAKAVDSSNDRETDTDNDGDGDNCIRRRRVKKIPHE